MVWYRFYLNWKLSTLEALKSGQLSILFVPMNQSVLVAVFATHTHGKENAASPFPHQPCQHRLSQGTTPSTNSGHHWQCMARKHPFEGSYRASTNTQSERLWKRTVRNAKRRTHGLCLSSRAFSQLVLVLDLLLRLLLPPAVSSNGAAFLQLSTTSSGEGRWLNLQIQHSRRIFYANFATTADWLTPVLDLLRASRH